MRRQKLMAQYPIDWSQEKIQAFRRTLLNWYDGEKRDLPWRENNDPYRIWVSEIMLQQTQVDTVIPYYERFIQTLPDVKALAQIEEEDLMGLWQGLGYYSRARNMKVAAQEIIDQYGGVIPNTYEGLISLKGIGPYTAGAISSMAFNLAEPAVDGNLMRITARLFELDDDISLISTRNKITGILYHLIDPNRPGDFNQALMDLGASIMTASNPYPEPEDHPLKDFDASYQNHTAHKFPVKKKKKPASLHHFLAYVIVNQEGEWLMRKHQKGELLAGLWHFPLVESDVVMEESTSADELIQALLDDEALNIRQYTEEDQPFKAAESSHPLSYQVKQYGQVKHVFSHRIWQVQLIPLKLKKEEGWQLDSNWQFVSPSQIPTLAMSTLQEKLIKQLFEEGRMD